MRDYLVVWELCAEGVLDALSGTPSVISRTLLMGNLDNGLKISFISATLKRSGFSLTNSSCCYHSWPPTSQSQGANAREFETWTTLAQDKGNVMVYTGSMSDLLRSSRLKQVRCILITGSARHLDLPLVAQDPDRLVQVLSGVLLVIFAGGCA
eukprot:4198927-Amphidinium_carterae.1